MFTRVLAALPLAATIILLGGGCGNQPPPASAPPAPAAPAPQQRAPTHLPHAQPRLRTLELWLGPHRISAELALTPTEVATGMMFRTNMLENEGMLFVFGAPHQTGFYMKNTTVPLSAAYIDSEGNILEIHDLQPLDERPVLAGSDAVQYVLEMPQGWFDRHQITAGAFIRTEKGTLPETFFRSQGRRR